MCVKEAELPSLVRIQGLQYFDRGNNWVIFLLGDLDKLARFAKHNECYKNLSPARKLKQPGL